MKIDVHGDGVEVPQTLLLYLQRRLGRALGRFADQVQWARVRLRDENGPRGGTDKRCVVHLRVKGHGDSVLHERWSELRAAFDLAAARAVHALTRQLARGRDLARTSRRWPGTQLEPELS
jgi:ribosome-associated translation inhibitor RaiA